MNMLRAAAPGALESDVRPSADAARRQGRHELALWLQPVDGPAWSVCEGCREQVPFLIWMEARSGWRCTGCIDDRSH